MSTTPRILWLACAWTACAEPGARSGATRAEPTPPPASVAPPASASAKVSVDVQSLVGKSLADVVASLHLEERDFRYVDEPPGKLKVVTLSTRPGTELELHLQYDSGLLFSESRAWPLSRIGPAKVLGLVERTAAERRVFGEIHSGLTGP